MNRHRPQPRSGWSLLELILVITMLGVLSTLAAQMFTIFFESDTRGFMETTSRLSMDRLADQFRQDVHQAAVVTIESPERMQIQTPSGEIVFEVKAHSVIRSVAQQSTSERFFTGADVSCEFERAEDLIKLICTRTIDHRNSDMRTSIQRDTEPATKEIAAVAGWDFRFTDQEGTP